MPIFQFIKNPQLDTNQDLSFGKKLSKTLFYRLATLSFTILLSFLLNLLMKKFGITEDQNMLYSFFSENKWRYVLLTAVVIGPILEELIFRSILKPKLWILFLWILGTIYMFTKGFISKSIKLHSLYSFESFLPYAGYILGFILVIVGLLWIIYRFHKYIYNFIGKYFAALFWLSCIIFGLVHITNFEEYIAPRYVYMIMVIPQFIIGIFLGFVRSNYGLGYSMMYHIMHNGILSFMLIYASFLGVDLTNFSQDTLLQNPQIILVIFSRVSVVCVLFLIGLRNILLVIQQKDNQ